MTPRPNCLGRQRPGLSRRTGRQAEQCPVCGLLLPPGGQHCRGCGFRLDDHEGLVPPMRLGTFGDRVLAQIADAIPLLIMCFFLISMPRAVVANAGNATSFVFSVPYAFVAVAVAYIVYHSVLIGLTGKTLGKLLLGLRVVRSDGTRCHWPCSFSRAALQIATLLPGIILYFAVHHEVDAVSVPGTEYDPNTVLLALGGLLYLWIPYDKYKRAIHDQLAKTLVISERR